MLVTSTLIRNAKRIALTALVLIFFCSPIYSQNIDSLLNGLAQAKTDTARIRWVRKLADAYSISDPIKAHQYDLKEVRLAKNTKDGNYIIVAWLRASFGYRALGQYDSLAYGIRQAVFIANKNPQLNRSPAAFLRAAHYLADNEMLDSAELYLTKASNLIQPGDPSWEEMILLQATIFRNRSQFDAAITKYLEVLKLSEKAGKPQRGVLPLINIANIYVDLKDPDKALEYCKRAEEISLSNNMFFIEDVYFIFALVYKQLRDWEKSIQYYQKARKLYESADWFDEIPMILLGIGEAYKELDNRDSSVYYFKKGLSLAKQYEFAPQTINGYAHLVHFYSETHKPHLAELYLDTLRGLSQADGSLKIMAQYQEAASKAYASMGLYEKAYEAQHLYTNLNDSLLTIRNSEQTKEIETRYQVAAKEKDIETLNAENRLKQLQLYGVLGITALLIIIVVLIVSRYRNVQQTRRRLEELDAIKSRFFANLSHEFRTPLSLIMGYLQKEIQSSDDLRRKELMAPLRNADRLKSLINQLLDLSKLQSGTMPLQVQCIDIAPWFQAMYQNFIGLAERKSIEYTLHVDSNLIQGYIDTDKVEKIVTNLLSNAFKFTPDGGTIRMKVNLSTDQLTVILTDTGIGIPQDKLPYIFNHFYQVDGSSTRREDGSGIGLALSKELTLLHKGRLTVESDEGNGSTFRLSLPISKQMYRPDEVVDLPVDKEILNIPEVELHSGLLNMVSERSLILVAEDNEDMQSFIQSILENDFNVKLVKDGKEAFQVAQEIVPDLIITDYMMPQMNGEEFIREIKASQPTSHIPVIMLTALDAEDRKLDSLRAGVNNFITKPFNIQELLLTVANLLRMQEQVKANYVRILETKPSPSPVYEDDESAFLREVVDLIKSRFHQPDFGVDQMADEIGLSRMQLHRKVKGLINKSPGELLRQVRMETAMSLLISSSSGNHMNIKEVATRVGFNSPPAFTKAFKEYTGLTPSEYVTQFVISPGNH